MDALFPKRYCRIVLEDKGDGSGAVGSSRVGRVFPPDMGLFWCRGGDDARGKYPFSVSLPVISKELDSE